MNLFLPFVGTSGLLTPDYIGYIRTDIDVIRHTTKWCVLGVLMLGSYDPVVKSPTVRPVVDFDLMMFDVGLGSREVSPSF